MSFILFLGIMLSTETIQNKSNANAHFFENLKELFLEDENTYIEIDVQRISGSNIDYKVYCFQSADNLIIYIKKSDTLLNSKYARISKGIYKNYFSDNTTLFTTNPFTTICGEQNHCTVDQLNFHRNLSHMVVLIKSQDEIERNQSMPIWVIEKSSDMISFNIEPCFD